MLAKKEIEAALKSIEDGNSVHNPVSEVSTLLNISANSTRKCGGFINSFIRSTTDSRNLKVLESNIEARFSQMLSAFIETIKSEHTNEPIKPEDKLLEMFMNNLMSNPQKGIQSFDALMKLQEKIDSSQKNQK